jgi:amidase
VQISLERIEELTPALNAFVQVDAERALASAAEIGPGDERPFAGVPTAIKNNRAAQGLRLTYGCALMEPTATTAAARSASRLRAAASWG